MAFLELSGVGKSFPSKDGRKEFQAVTDIRMIVERGQFASLIGHSGCGKSTLLDMIAGLTKPTRGTIVCDGETITGPGRDRAMVFQSHALLPWLTCRQNVELAIEEAFRGQLSKAEIRERARQALSRVRLEHAEAKHPAEISGGMKQRVGIARALAVEPKLLLLDEPFGALDALTRASLQDELLEILSGSDCTVVMVTHDLDEAILLSDVVFMMNNGPSANIGQALTVDIPRPRERLMLTHSPEAGAYRAALIEFLYEKQGHGRPAA